MFLPHSENQLVCFVVFRDLLAYRDPTVHREKRGRGDPGVNPVPLDHLDLMERE